jgi:hypothetical protein
MRLERLVLGRGKQAKSLTRPTKRLEKTIVLGIVILTVLAAPTVRGAAEEVIMSPVIAQPTKMVDSDSDSLNSDGLQRDEMEKRDEDPTEGETTEGRRGAQG